MTTMTASEAQAQIVVDKLNDLDCECSLVGVVEAPQLIRVELTPTGRTKMRDFRRLNRADDLAYALGAERVNIVAPVPGRSVVAVEFDRKDRQLVSLDDMPSATTPLLVPLGVEIDGRPALLPLTDAPHALIAGQTGSGKTTALHTILAGLVASHTPQELQLMLVDPKRVELTAWEQAPHVGLPVADNTEDAINQLRALVWNMDERYHLFSRIDAKNITQANEILPDHGAGPVPYVVCVVDELADLMMTSSKEVEGLLVRLAQKGRAAGIHLILSTQYPKREVLTGLLRVNMPTRICFAVPDMTASRLILDRNGGETLLGRGDGLLSLTGLPATRFQGALTTSNEITSIINERGQE